MQNDDGRHTRDAENAAQISSKYCNTIRRISGTTKTHIG